MGIFSKGTEEDIMRDYEARMADPVWRAEQEESHRRVEQMMDDYKGTEFKPLPILDKLRETLIKEMKIVVPNDERSVATIAK